MIQLQQKSPPMRINQSGFLFAIIISCCSIVLAEEPQKTNRYEKTVASFEKQELANPPCSGKILLMGSSSIRLWGNKKWFPNKTTYNCGFGGSEISDQLFFFDRIVPTYKPSVILFYCGDNDIAKKKTEEQVINDFRTFVKRVHKILPKTDIIYLPIKPSIARWNLWDKMDAVNQAILKDAKANGKLHYCDTAKVILNKEGKPDPAFFKKDGLHLNEHGYARWTKEVNSTLAIIESSK